MSRSDTVCEQYDITGFLFVPRVSIFFGGPVVLWMAARRPAGIPSTTTPGRSSPSWIIGAVPQRERAKFDSAIEQSIDGVTQ